jgi:hypothetical protein
MNVTTGASYRIPWWWVLAAFLLGLAVALLLRPSSKIIRFTIDPDSGVVYLAPKKDDVIIWYAVSPDGKGYSSEYAHIHFPPGNSPCKETEDGGHECTITGDKGYFHYYCSADSTSTSEVTCVDPGTNPGSTTYLNRKPSGFGLFIETMHATVEAAQREGPRAPLPRYARGALVEPLQLVISCDASNNAVVKSAIPGEMMKALRGQVIQWNGGKYGYTIDNLDPDLCAKKTGVNGEVSCRVSGSIPNSSSDNFTPINFRVTTTKQTGKQMCSGAASVDSVVQVDNVLLDSPAAR